MRSVLALAGAALLLSAGTQAKSPEIFRKPVNVTLTDSSPLLVYEPREADPTTVNYKYNPDLWNTTFPRRPWSEWQPGTLGRGDSAHQTNKAGNRVSVTWIGTAIAFKGSCENNCKVSLSIDGGDEEEITPRGGDDTLASCGFSTGDNTERTATLVLKEGAIGLSHVVLSTLVDTYATDVGKISQEFMNSTESTGLGLPNVSPAVDSKQADGSVWHTADDLGNDLDRMKYTRLDTFQIGFAQFKIPPNSTLVTLFGTMNLDHGNFSVTVTPPPTGAKSGKRQLNGFATWSIINTPLYVAPLDPHLDYTLRLDNEEDGLYVDFNSATFLKLNPEDAPQPEPAKDPPSGGISAGAISGIVVGGVVGALIAGSLIGYFLWKRRNAHAHRYNQPGPYVINGDERFEVDPTVQTTQYTLSPSGSGQVSTLGYTHFTPLGEEIVEKPQVVRPRNLAIGTNLKRPIAGFESVPLSPSGSGSRNGSGLLVPAAGTEAELAALGTSAYSSQYGTPSHGSSSGARTGGSGAPLVDYVNAQDAGPIRTQVEMPPSYNPEWAGDGSRASSATGAGQEGERTGSPARMNSILKAAKGLI